VPSYERVYASAHHGVEGKEDAAPYRTPDDAAVFDVATDGAPALLALYVFYILEIYKQYTNLRD
jgi:hypothetical protein